MAAALRNTAFARGGPDPRDRRSDFFVLANSHYVPRGAADMRAKARELEAILQRMVPDTGGAHAPIFDIIGRAWPDVRSVEVVAASVELGKGAQINPATGRRGRGPGKQLHMHFKIHITHRINDDLGRQKARVQIGHGRYRRGRRQTGLDPVGFQARMKAYFDSQWAHTSGFFLAANLSLSSAEYNYTMKDARAKHVATSQIVDIFDQIDVSARSQATDDVVVGIDRLRL